MTEKSLYRNQIITIDGPAASGKSSVTKTLAEDLGYYQLDSGALYRAVTFLALEFADKGDMNIEEALIKQEFHHMIEKLPITIGFLRKKQKLYLSERLLDVELRTPHITQNIKFIADSSFVRTWVNQKLRSVAEEYNIVVDGRDMGTEVFPEANKKFYLTATLEERATRRFNELKQSGFDENIELLTKEMEKRDQEDKGRIFGRLKKAKDAIEIDTTNIPEEEVIKKIKRTFVSEMKEIPLQEILPALQENSTLPLKPEPEPKLKPEPKLPLKPEETKKGIHQTQSLPTLDLKQENSVMEKLMNQGGFDISDIKEGHTVISKVIRKEPAKNPEYILVDLNSKSEGIIPIDDFDFIPEAGTKIEAMVTSFDQETGLVKLSKRMLDIQRTMHLLEDSHEKELPVTGKIIRKLSQGYIVDIEKVEMFLPHSHLGNMFQENSRGNQKSILGGTYTYNIIELDKKRITGVVSRKKWQDTQNKTHWESLANETEIGSIVHGEVLHHVRIGVFIKIHNVIAFLHRSNISWGKQQKRIDELYPAGSTIMVRILDMDQKNMKMSLGLKQLTNDPWKTILSDLKVGSETSGSVSYIAQYGAFVDLDNDLEGFVPVTEMSWTRKLDNPNKVLSLREKLNFKVLAINSKEKKITLGIKQLQENPWNVLVKKIKVGDARRGRIKYITSYGVFVQIEENIDGLIRKENISWKERLIDPMKKFKKNQEIDFKIMNIDAEDQKISCSIKHLDTNPYEYLQKKYSNNNPLIDGKVLKVAEYGLFILLPEENMTGLAHNSEIPRGRIGDIKGGDEIKVTIKHVDTKNEKIALSLKGAEHAIERVEMNKYINKKKTTLTNNPFSSLKDLVFESK